MNSAQQLFRNILQASGYSVTKARQRIFTALEISGPLSTRELIKHVGPAVNRASVYRTIALFENLGIIQRLQIGWKYRLELSNALQEHHHHLTCLQCGQIIPFHEQDKLRHLLESVADAHNFTLQNHQLELQGLCEMCRTNA